MPWEIKGPSFLFVTVMVQEPVTFSLPSQMMNNSADESRCAGSIWLQLTLSCTASGLGWLFSHATVVILFSQARH